MKDKNAVASLHPSRNSRRELWKKAIKWPLYSVAVMPIILAAGWKHGAGEIIRLDQLLGFVLAFQSEPIKEISSYSLMLFLSVGFLGSLSTFSTFMVEIVNTFVEYSWFESLGLLICSVLVGLLAAAAGYSLRYV